MMIVHVLLTLTMVMYYIILQVALKLLDSEFPNFKVRKFPPPPPPKVLEQILNEKLEDFLLQLTQVCTTG